jgi:sigma-B regulation protein RsbU (phosphoserine phosphatase)
MPENQLSECSAALAKGADDWLARPINPNELKARVLAGKHILQLKQELQEQKQLLEAELAEAEAYVRSLLPGDLTEKIPINARFIPSRLLGGDSYDYYWLDPDYLVIYLLDVSGHGLGSALLSTSVLNMLRSQSLPDVNFYRPEKVLKALNDTFQMNDQNEKYFTMWYGVYNRANRQLLYASAGHPPAVLISQTEQDPQTVECLKTSGLPIGMMPDVQYHWQRCHIPPASRLYLFSDGVYEIKQMDNTIMGLNDFIEILSEHPADCSIDNILAQVEARTRDRTLSDDLSLLEVHLD